MSVETHQGEDTETEGVIDNPKEVRISFENGVVRRDEGLEKVEAEDEGQHKGT